MLNLPSQGTEEELETRDILVGEFSIMADELLTRYSSLKKLVKSVAWLMKFITYLKHKHKGGDQVNRNLSVDDVKRAEIRIIKCVQAEVFSQELARLQRGEPVASHSQLSKLSPKLEDALIKVGGRLQDTASDVNKSPIILPRHSVTDLIIKQVHEENGHVGTNHCLSTIGERYHIVRGYSTVKSVVDSCFLCKKQKRGPMTQQMGPLPEERSRVDEPPFSSVGVDYFGPVNVKHGRGSTKRYGCLFTCLVTRAIHLEVAHSLSSDAFLLAFHRFTARRGKPLRIWSDNGTNFVAADKELKEAVKGLNDKRLNDAMLLDAIEWNFIPPHAPHMGGAWERLVRSVKTVMRSLIKQQLLTDEELTTFMCEVERIINDRPLTRFSSDSTDEEPLTPNHLLLLRRNACTATTYDNYVQRRWQVIQHIANAFYKRFVREYLPTLQQRNKWLTEKTNLQVNDIVLVAEENSPRGHWPIGLVIEVNRSRDNLVRSAKIKIGKSTKTRPITQLVHLEHHE